MGSTVQLTPQVRLMPTHHLHHQRTLARLIYPLLAFRHHAVAAHVQSGADHIEGEVDQSSILNIENFLIPFLSSRYFMEIARNLSPYSRLLIRVDR